MIHVHNCKECARLVRELGRGDEYIVTRFLPSGDGIEHFVTLEDNVKRIFCSGQKILDNEETFLY